ncbi:hypothetical protein SAMN05216419_10654 [Nitrosomonas cryotolerans]|uniref:Uncharacterized protein n=2 Tax=Nitrosomonas cryotolerans TaxID=44575 RepID=A0A1N6JYK2_9PROT|nr:hypothetical protein SAMN05216419_10654 [Nitrosomonas cryotolerans]SIO49126.1 hypothetical protein SAMN02743940_0016 [Nitrosomonas cryotolerans ATCC 49181]
MKSKDSINQGIAYSQGLWNQQQGDALNKALSDYGKGIQESISQKGGGFTNQSMDVQQGFAAEAHHTGSFNIEAASKGQNNHRATRDVGAHNDPVADIHVTTPDGTTRHQVKFYKDGEKTAAALSPEKYDNVGKIVPKDQVDSVKASAHKQALRNEEIRPNVSKSNQDTADNATDTLTSSDGKISSKGLNRKGDGSAEELVKEAKTKENGPEYKEKGRVRSDFNSMQYRNAAKAGAIGGAVSESATILLEVLRSDEPLTMDQCMEAAQRVVVSSVKGAGNALLITSIQHAGQAMIDAAAKQTGKAISQTIGKQLIKGNVAAAVAQITVQLAQNLYKFSTGEIDNLQFASSTIGGAVQVVGTSLAFNVGTGVGVYLGASVPAAISGYAIGGTTLGSLGVIASGAVFAIGFAVAAGAYVNHFSSKGVALANTDLKSALDLLNGGQIDLSTYVGKVGKMSDLTFSWSDILPFSGAISVISEYGSRKNQLRAVQSSILNQLDALPEQEREMMQELANQYSKAITDIDRQYEEARASITKQAFDQFDSMSKNLSQHLEMQYLMFAPIRKNYIEGSVLMDIELRKQQENHERSQAFTRELEGLQNKLKSFIESNQADRTIRQAVQETILTRMEILIPNKTGWDQACEFLELQ